MHHAFVEGRDFWKLNKFFIEVLPLCSLGHFNSKVASLNWSHMEYLLNLLSWEPELIGLYSYYFSNAINEAKHSSHSYLLSASIFELLHMLLG